MSTSTIITIVTLAVSTAISLAGGVASEVVKGKETKEQVAQEVRKNLK